jgi:hypothetical protein
MNRMTRKERILKRDGMKLLRNKGKQHPRRKRMKDKKRKCREMRIIEGARDVGRE